MFYFMLHAKLFRFLTYYKDIRWNEVNDKGRRRIHTLATPMYWQESRKHLTKLVISHIIYVPKCWQERREQLT